MEDKNKPDGWISKERELKLMYGEDFDLDKYWNQYELLYADKFGIKITEVPKEYSGPGGHVLVYHKDTNITIQPGDPRIDEYLKEGKIGYGIVMKSEEK